MPSDIGAQLKHTHPEYAHDYNPNPGANVKGCPFPLTLDNLDVLNTFDMSTPKMGADIGDHIYLSRADEDITKGPSWLFGVRPNAEGKTEGAKPFASSSMITVQAILMYSICISTRIIKVR